MQLADALQLVAQEMKPAKSRVLLVDDNNVVRMSVAGVLQHSGFEVETAANVAGALGLIATKKFDALVSDLHMPNAGDGLTVVNAMSRGCGTLFRWARERWSRRRRPHMGCCGESRGIRRRCWWRSRGCCR